ncbi:hypothetical protein BC940DRAFT_289075 [Gongronella butleri]|nr:hypothetical protein BC940DRAFT_289075 [Gongronella butleri]
MERQASVEMVPIYMQDVYEPTAVAIAKQARQPFKFKTYPRDIVDGDEAPVSPSKSQRVQTVTKAAATEYLSRVLHLEQPMEAPAMYDHSFVTSSELALIVNERFASNISGNQAERWVSATGLFGDRSQPRNESTQRQRGRRLFIMKKSYRDQLPRTSLDDLKSYLRSHQLTTIGFARKSETGTKTRERIRSLTSMVEELESMGCTDIYASLADASEPLITAQSTLPEELATNIPGLKGDGKAFIRRLAASTTRTRVVILDWAGLSTDVGHMRKFLMAAESLDEMIVKEKNVFHVLTIEQLQQNDVLKKFHCRRGFPQRSGVV